MNRAADPVLMELHQATNAAGPHLGHAHKERLKMATRAVILAAQHGELLLNPPTEAAVLEQLRRLIRLAQELRIDWPTVVGVINREE